MTRMVANMLDMVRVETGGLAVQLCWQPLEALVGVALLRLEEQLARHPVEVDLSPLRPLVPVDDLLLGQVFLNLLENAARYTPTGTAVAVRAWETYGAVCVEVADGGPGIPAEAE